MMPSWTPVAIFAASYAAFVMLPRHRTAVAVLGAVSMVLAGGLTWRQALMEKIHWNVVALFFGTLILAELFMQSRMPAVMAEALVRRTHTVRGAMLAVCALAGFLSIFVENVAVVLLVAPVALSLAEQLNLSPIRLLICIAVSTNLQGTATLIGDPPSMILAGYLKLNFNDFFVYAHRPGIFFAVQVGALAALGVVYWLLRAHREKAAPVEQEPLRSWVPLVLLTVLILGLSGSSHVDPDFRWLAGSFTLVLAAVGLLWYRLGPHWSPTRTLLRSLDWDTTFFLMGVFVLVGGLTESGWLDQLAGALAHLTGRHLLRAYTVIVGVSVILSAFVDNVPFLLAMIPVVQKVADRLDAPVPLLMYGLLIGACLGGNITPFGASANVVTVGLLKKRGHTVSFREFLAVGLPFTLAAVTASSAFVWWIWAP